MNFGIDPPSGPAEARTNLRRFCVVLGIGFAGVMLTVVVENRTNFEHVSGIMVLIEAAISLLTVGAAIPVAREPSLRRLSLLGLEILAAPLVLVVLLNASHAALGFDDDGGWSLLYYTVACVITGLRLLIVAGGRFAIQRRRSRQTDSPN